ncbi:vacuolar ATPase assembly integral membrane protein VMA21 homolog [Diprion similis]|uniref:vacuolar ATPase assembly integral membrane protein VMA21 homolog n=1 Tax=Diprion similis TaxID=362088 RepID=UPI001EF9A521|nr:vacuolar ATPase assembly integral membrane protein VMA21 homolog [Diprion similis]
MSTAAEPSELQVFKTVFFHCIVIIVMPVLSFFTSKIFIFDGLLNLNTVPSNVYAAGVSIIVLHTALGAFIYRAYFDSQPKVQVKID